MPISSSKWVPGGPGDVPHQERCFLHPDGPQLGKFWNKQSCVAFDKLKLTNNRKPSQRDQVRSLLSLACNKNSESSLMNEISSDSPAFNASLPAETICSTDPQ